MEIGHRQPKPWRNPSLQFSANPAVARQDARVRPAEQIEATLRTSARIPTGPTERTDAARQEATETIASYRMAHAAFAKGRGTQSAVRAAIAAKEPMRCAPAATSNACQCSGNARSAPVNWK